MGIKDLELILAFKGWDSRNHDRNNYNILMVALQRKLDDEHKRELIRCPVQKANESLPVFARVREISAAHIPERKPTTGRQF